MSSLPSVEIASETNHTAGTVYYPSDVGAELGGYSNLGLGITAEDCDVSVEATVDGSNWVEVTWYLMDTFGGWLGGPVTFAAGAAATATWLTWGLFPLPVQAIRLAVTYPNDSNEFSAHLLRGGE